MALTPDQKKRIAALDVKPVDNEEEPPSGSRVFSARLRAFALSVRMSSLKSVVVKLLIVCALLAAAGSYIVNNQLHEIDFREVFSSARGSPITRLADAVKLQREKTELLGEGRGQLLGGEYEEAFKTAMAVKKLDAGDLRVRALIADTTNAVVEAARQEFESGKIEDALVDVRLALGYKADHAGANRRPSAFRGAGAL
jgi:hypothetical protein